MQVPAGGLFTLWNKFESHHFVNSFYFCIVGALFMKLCALRRFVFEFVLKIFLSNTYFKIEKARSKCL